MKILLIILLAISAAAQSTSQQVTLPTTGFAGLDKYRASRIAVYVNDYGQLARYRDANSGLPAPASNESRVVFFGDSITDIWKLDDSFPGKHYINRGIGGQTTSQMLVRFRQDVIDLQPKIVVVLAGTNDIAGNSGPIANQDIEANLASMAELAKAHGKDDFRVDSAGEQLHARVAGVFCIATAGENTGVEWLAQGLLREEGSYLSRLFQRHGR
jgi:hypothetical protein